MLNQCFTSPDLGWRDIQHLIVYSSNPLPLLNNAGWKRTEAGLSYNTAFGFGLMNADRFIQMATSNWINVPPVRTDSIHDFTIENDSADLRPHYPVNLTYLYDGPIRSAEHIEFVFSISYPRRGAIAVYIISPLKTTVQLLGPRPLDRSAAGFDAWPLISVATWAEDPRGVWKVMIVDEVCVKNILVTVIKTFLFYP